MLGAYFGLYPIGLRKSVLRVPKGYFFHAPNWVSSPAQQVVSTMELELGSVLHSLGAVEHLLSVQAGREATCLAQVVCGACRKEGQLKGAITTTYRSGPFFLWEMSSWVELNLQ